MSAARKSSTSSADFIVTLLLALTFVGALMWLPLRKGSAASKIAGILGIVGVVVTAIWWLLADDKSSPALTNLAFVSVALFALALVLRLLEAMVGTRASSQTPPTFSDGPRLLPSEVQMFQDNATFLGNGQLRVHGGLGFPLVGRLFAGVGLSAPLSTLRPVDQGSFVVTNQRVLLLGNRKTVCLRIRNLLEAGIQGDFLILRPDRGSVLVISPSDPGKAIWAVQAAMKLSR